MRKLLAPTLILMLVLLLPAVTNFDQGVMELSSGDISPGLSNTAITSAAGSSGTDALAVLSMSRTITGLDFEILNSYSDATHSGAINLAPYQLSGWFLYSAEIDATTINATAERKTLTINPDNAITISNNSGLIRDALYQEFYNQPHDGKLENYTFSYLANPYDGALGDAFLVVRSNYSNSATNVSGYVTPFSQTTGYEVVTHDCSADNAILNASTFYYVVIDGTAMVGQYIPFPVEAWVFNTIAWRAQYPYEGLDTGYHLRGSDWDHYDAGEIREAELNYTYTPWNKTSDTALTYTDATQIGLTANASAQNGMSWIFTATDNISLINFESTLSINIGYNITLNYQKNDTGTTVWKVINSGNQVQWNVTASLSFPTLSGTVTNYLNITVQTDWTPTGLYNATSSDYGHYTKFANIVYCTEMTNGTWTLSNSADNYVTAIDLSDSSTGIPLIDKVSILVDVDIDVTVENGTGTPATTGSTNLTIWYDGSVIHAPPDESISAGLASYVWDIDSIADHNGTHTLEIFWTDGVEAGYLTRDIFIFYPTTLDADDDAISAYTDNTFDIGIDFNQTYPVRGLDGSLAAVTYSLGSIITNDTMDDAGGGRWTKTVSTATMTSGTYVLTVYAEGFALENQTLTIDVDLTIETQALNWSWSPSNVITYLESTNLTVSYRDSLGNNIPDALVNITFDSTTYDLTWDATSELYWIQLNGSDFLTVPGTTVMTLNAWKAGYTSQYNDTIAITVNEESTGIGLIVDWNPIDRNITYIEQVTINVTYTYNSVPINDTWDGVWVRATFSGHPLVNLTYNAGQWEVILNGSDYLGVTTVTIRASATGYGQEQDVQDLLVVEDMPALVNSWTDSSASTDYETNILLQITVRDSSGAFINGATLTVNAFGTEIPMSFSGDGLYQLLIDPQETKGLHTVNVTIAETGYVITSTFLNLTVSATTDIDVDYISSEYEQWNLTITVTYTDTFYSTPITGATVTVTIDGVEYALTYDNDTEVYVREILLDFDSGTYTLTAVANAPNCNEATEAQVLNVMAKDAVYLSLTTEGDPSVEGQLLSIIATLHYNGTDIAVPNVNIHFIVTIHYVNGTVEVRDDPSQYDTTNIEGVASWGFEIPSGTIESITVEAEYPGYRDKWATSLQYVVAIGSNPLMLILSFLFFTDIGRLLVVTLLVLGIVATAYNKKVKPRKRAARDSLENQLQMFRDLETLRHFMAVYLDRGTCVFYHPFTDERIQPDLISGFIAAITSVYGEIKGDGVRGTLEEIQYQGLRLNSYSGEFLIGILILEGEMTPLLRDRLQFFIELFENQYDKDLTDWTGLIDCFDPEWVVSNLTSAYNYSWLHAHKFGPTQKVAKTDARILDYISAVRDDKGEFYIKNLISPLAEMLDQTEAQILDRLLYLQDNGMIVPVSIQTILQRQGMGLANGEISPDNIVLEPPIEEEPKVEEPETPVEETSETEMEPEPVEESPPPGEAESVDDFVKDVESLMTTEPEEEKDEKTDSIDDFVKDVESLLTKEKGKEENEES